MDPTYYFYPGIFSQYIYKLGSHIDIHLDQVNPDKSLPGISMSVLSVILSLLGHFGYLS